MTVCFLAVAMTLMADQEPFGDAGNMFNEVMCTPEKGIPRQLISALNGLMSYFNDTAVGQTVFPGGLEKRTFFQPPLQVPLSSPIPFPSSLSATNPGSSFDQLSETYLKHRFIPNTNEEATTLAIAGFNSFTHPDPANPAVQDFWSYDFWSYNKYFAVHSPADPSIQGAHGVTFPTSQDLHQFLNGAPQNGHEGDFIESSEWYQNHTLTGGLTHSGQGVFESVKVPEPPSSSVLVIVLIGLVAISLRRNTQFQ